MQQHPANPQQLRQAAGVLAGGGAVAHQQGGADVMAPLN